MSKVPELILQRRTVRRVRPTPLTDELVDALIEAACAAPSAHNCQPWRFVLVRTATARDEFARAMGEAFCADLEADGVLADNVQHRVGSSIARLSSAPLLVIACLVPEDMQRYSDAARQRAEHVMGVQSVAAAVENLLLAATGLGLGAGWMCAPLFCQDVVRRVLQLPPEWEPQALVTAGWPDESPALPPRRPRQALVVKR